MMDLSLYLIATRGKMDDEAFLSCVKAAIKGGVSVVQLREKELCTRAFCNLAFKLKALCDELLTPLIINDRVDVAMAVNAAGVHLGQDDMSVSAARALLGRDKIVGLSVKNLAQLEFSEGADYVGVGAIFFTQTKDSSVIGVENLRKIALKSTLPVVAIGGINEKNLPLLKNAEISGIAVSSAIMNAKNPYKAATNLRNLARF